MVKLRNFTNSDADLLVQYLNNTKVTQYITDAIPKPYTTQDAKWWIDIHQNDNNVRAIAFNGDLVGCISATVGQFEYSCGAELGYWIAEDFLFLLIATTAVKQFTEHLFHTTNLVRLFVSVVADNIGSIRVLEKNGYVLEGTLKQASCKNGVYYDERLLVKIRK